MSITRLKTITGIMTLIFGLSGCAVMHTLEEAETEVYVEEKTRDELIAEWYDKAYNTYKTEIGKTIPGERIVQKTDYGDKCKFDVWKFDNSGYTHKFYLMAYDREQHLQNSTTMLEEVSIAKNTLNVDNSNNVVSYEQEYILMGDNAYEFFMQAMWQELEEEARRLDLDEKMATRIVKDDYTISYLGNLVEPRETVPKEQEIIEDEDGYILMSAAPELFTTEELEDGTLAITGYTGTGGNKLIFPKELDGKVVSCIKQMEPIPEVAAVMVHGTVKRLENSFMNWSGLNHLIIEEGVTFIDTFTLSGTNIQEISLPDSIEQLGENFYQNNALTNYRIPAGVKDITKVFSGSSIQTVIVPKTVKVVGIEAFNNCTNLTTVFIEDGVEAIGDNAFNNCSALEAIAVPKSVQSISEIAFSSKTLFVVEDGSYAKEWAEAHEFQYAIQ